MNEKFITEVLQLAIGCWNSDRTKCKQFDFGLRMLLQKYKDMEERCTDVMDIEKVIYNFYNSFLYVKKQKVSLFGH